MKRMAQNASFISDEEQDSTRGVRAKKSLGQNFLMHQATAERIADAARLSKDAVVLEIGPGTGMLTRALLSRARKVIAVEADASLVEKLRETFAKEITEGALELTHGDIRAFNYSQLPASYHLVANIPYYITGEIIRSFLSGAHQPASITLLVQKEVAERIAREEKGNLLSLSVRAYGAPHYAFTVPRGAFIPAPKVDSAVLSITDISRAHFGSSAEEERFFTLIRAGFAHKRKQLFGNLKEHYDEQSLTDAFQKIGIAPKARAEDLTLPVWLDLARVIR